VGHRTNVCAFPFSPLSVDVSAARRIDRLDDVSRRMYITRTPLYIALSLSRARARVGDARSPQRTCRSARAISAFCCVLSDVEGGCFSTLRAVEMTTGALSRTCSSLRYVIDESLSPGCIDS